MKSGHVKIISVLCGIALLAFIFLRINLKQVFDILVHSKPEYIILSFAVLAFLLVLKGFKWKLLLEAQKTQITTLKSAKYFCIGFFFSSFTPGKIGDFVRGLYVKKQSGLSVGFSSVLIDRVLDILVLALVAIASSVYMLQVYGIAVFPISSLVIGTIIFAAAAYFSLNEKFMANILRPFFKKLVPNTHKEKAAKQFRSFYSAVRLAKTNKKPVILAGLVTLVFWIFEVIFSYVVALGLGIDIPLYFLAVIFPIISISDALPISVSGIGTRDALLVFFFSLIGLAAEPAVAFSVMIFILSYLVISTIGYLFYLTEPIDIKDALSIIE